MRTQRLTDACCSPKVLEKLDKIAYEMDDRGCPKEPSERVRRVARLAMRACGGNVVPTPLPTEGPPDGDETIEPAAEGPDAQAAALSQPFALGSSWLGGGEPRATGGEVQEHGPPGGSFHSTPGTPQRQVFRNSVNNPASIGDPGLVPEASRLVTPAGHVEVDRRTFVIRRLPPLTHATAGPGDHEGADHTATELPRANVPSDDMVPHGEMLARYSEVRWERVSVPFDRLPSRTQADAVLTVLRKGALGVANETPPGIDFRAVESRVFGWIDPNSVSSRSLSNALMTTPVGGVSPVFEDSAGMHVVRVLERRTERLLSFENAPAQVGSELVQPRQYQ